MQHMLTQVARLKKLWDGEMSTGGGNPGGGGGGGGGLSTLPMDIHSPYRHSLCPNPKSQVVRGSTVQYIELLEGYSYRFKPLNLRLVMHKAGGGGGGG